MKSKNQKFKLITQSISSIIATFTILAVAPSANAQFDKPRQVSESLTSSQNITQFEITNNSQRVIYSRITSTTNRLFSARIGGGPSVSEITDGRYLSRYVVSEDGERIAYVTAPGIANTPNRLTTRLTNMQGSTVELSPELGGGKEIGQVKFSPDGNWVVFMSEQETNNLVDLYSVPSTGPSTSGARLNDNITPPVGSEVIGVQLFSINPTSTHVVYLAKHADDTTSELYSVPIDGSAGPTQLSEFNSSNRSLGADGKIAFSSDGSAVIFVSDQDTDDVFEVYSVSIDGPSSSAMKLSHDLSGGFVQSFAVSTDADFVVYFASDSSFNYELFSVPIDGSSEPEKLNPDLGADRDVYSDFKIASNGSKVVFRADLDVDNVPELYSVPIVGPNSSTVKLNEDMVTGQSVEDFEITNNSQIVVFTADLETSGFKRELFMIDIAGEGMSRRLNSELEDEGNVQSDFKVSSDDSFVVYLAEQEVDGIIEVFLASLLEDVDADKINDPFPEGGSIGAGFISIRSSVGISPNSEYIVYAGEQNSADKTELFSARKSQDDLCVVMTNAQKNAFTVCL